MRKHLSVLALYIRATARWILPLLAVTAAAEGALLSRQITPDNGSYMDLFLYSEQCHMEWACLGFFLVLMTLLCLSGTSYGSRTDYTLQRLSIRPQTAFLWQSVCYCIWITAFWALQALLLVVCSNRFLLTTAENVGPQTLLTHLYQWDFSANLLPLACVIRWIRNILLVMALGASAAYFSWQQRKGSFGFCVILSVLLCVFAFLQTANLFLTMLGVIGALLIMAYVVIHIVNGKEEDALEALRQDTTAAAAEHPL